MKYIGTGLTLILSIVVWVVVRQLSGENDPQSSFYYWSIGYPILLMGSMFLGAYLPISAWRWGVLITTTQLILGMLISEGGYNLLLIGIILHVIYAVPLILFSYLGVWISKKEVKGSE